MKKVLLIFLILGLFSCKKDSSEQNKDNDPIPVTLELTSDYTPTAGYYEINFFYTDIYGNYMERVNPVGNKVTDVDFSQYVKVTGRKWNNFQGNVLSNWYLKKDGDLIDSHSVSEYIYTNQ